MVNTVNHIGMFELLGNVKLFINVAEDMLLGDSIDLMSQKRVTIELLENIEVTPKIVERVRDLKAAGYEVALDDYVFGEQPCPLFDLVDIIKVDILQNDLTLLPQIVKHLRQWPCRLLAEKVESQEVYELCKQAGFDLFQGYYFARPTRLGGRRADPGKITLLNLISLVGNDGKFNEIETSVKANPGLTFHLLRLINSSAYYPGTKIGSVAQAIHMLGLNQFGRWLQMLLFIDNNDQACASLLELAVQRARLMELIAAKINVVKDHAYMAGMFSLAENAIGISMQEILEELNLFEEICQALLNHTGKIGALLEICLQLENADFEKVTELAELLHVEMPDLMRMQAEAIGWANQQMQTMLSGHSESD